MLSSLTLTNFRSHVNAEFNFEPGINVVVGNNAVGKTNILEALWLLNSGDSFRAKQSEDMISWDESVAHVNAKIVDDSSMDPVFDNLHVILTRGKVNGKKTAKRIYQVNGVNRTKANFIGKIPQVLFRPEDLSLLTADPTHRRNSLNDLIIQLDKNYYPHLHRYEATLKRRNKILDAIREGQTTASSLYFWDKVLLEEAEYLRVHRQAQIDVINSHPTFRSYYIGYQPSILTPSKLKDHYPAEVAIGHTLSGPHRDDYSVFDRDHLKLKAEIPNRPDSGIDSVNNFIKDNHLRNLGLYGSRGEQRMVMLTLKLTSIDLIEAKLHHRPILLLDDVFSELDTNHDQIVLNLASRQQTIITTTDIIKGLEGNIISL